MKTKKILIPIITTTCLSTTLVPLATLSSCNDDKKVVGNLMEEYTPTIAPRAAERYENQDKALYTYLQDVSENPEIFKQDLIYTISRGMPQYISYVSEFCEITSHDFNIDLPTDKIYVDTVNRTIKFDATFHVQFDYSKTKREEMIWYDMYWYQWDTQTEVEMVLDFNTTKEDSLFLKHAGWDVGQKQMTTYAGATQFAFSEIGSTIQLLSEKGYKVDLDNKHYDIDVTEKSIPYHFMLPNKAFWMAEAQTETYYSNYVEVWDLWFNECSLQCIVLMIKYYMPSNAFVALDPKSVLPQTFDFGSYYMQNASLANTWTIDTVDNKQILYGFNRSLDSINNLKNIALEQEGGKPLYHDGTFTLPSIYKSKAIDVLGSHAFDGDLSTYTNLGIPTDVKTVEIPAYDEIKPYAISGNGGLSDLFDFGFDTLVIKKVQSKDLPVIGVDAFYHLFEVETIDLSGLNSNDYSWIQTNWKGAFNNIHMSIALAGTELPDGTIKLPSGYNKTYWKPALEAAGIKEHQDGQAGGWVFE